MRDMDPPIEIMSILILKNDALYMLNYLSPVETFDKNLETVQGIIDSIKIDNRAVPILLYENPTYGFKIKHPANWFETEVDFQGNHMIAFISPYKSLEDVFPEETNVVIGKIPKDLSFDSYYDGNIKVLRSVIRNFNLIETRPVTFSGIPAKEIIYTGKYVIPFIENRGIPSFFGEIPLVDVMNLALGKEIDSKIRQIFFFKDENYYVITYRASPDDYDSSYAKAQEIIGSFDFYDPKSPASVAIPDWIRNNAKWWSEGSITDDDFTKGIQFLIKEGIMKIPKTESSPAQSGQKIPDWIKNNAKWWSDDQISDNDFLKGIQYLVEHEIIKV